MTIISFLTSIKVCCEFLKSPLGYSEFRTEGVKIEEGRDCDGVLEWADRVFAPDAGADADGMDDDGAIADVEGLDTGGNAFLAFKLESLSPASPPLVDLDPTPSSPGDEGLDLPSSSPTGVK